MIERPVKLSFAATHVIKASRELSWPEKAVWLEDWALDQGPEGAWISGEGLAERLGLSSETAETYRRRFLESGLHHRVKRPGARTPGWVATLPDGCEPRSQRPSPAEITELSRRLDWQLKSGRQSAVKADGGTLESVRRSALKADGGPDSAHEGGRGEPPSSASVRKHTLHPQSHHEDGVGALAPKGRWERPLSADEIAEFKSSLDRQVANGKLTREQADKLRRVSGL